MPTINKLVRKGRARALEKQKSGLGKLSAKKGRLHAGLYDNAQKAEFSAAQSGEGEIEKRVWSHFLYWRRRPKFAGALGCADPRRSREGFAGRALPHGARRAGYAGCEGSQAGALQIRCETRQDITEGEPMPRRREVPKREILPDPKFGSVEVAKFMNVLMLSGKKAIAERIVYGAFEHIRIKNHQDPVEVFSVALNNVKPVVEVKGRRVGGANYQVPIEVRPSRRMALSMRWLREAAKKRSEKSMAIRLAAELMEAFEGRGGAMKKRDEVHRMAEANKAFSHFRF